MRKKIYVTLYSVTDQSPVHDYDTQSVIQNLINVNIGKISDKREQSNALAIVHFTSYQNPENKEEAKNSDSDETIDDDVASALKIGAKLIKALDSYHYIKIGPDVKQFFDTTNVIYYSNSQFPSNEKFFSEEASSFDATNIDVPFWMLYRNLSSKAQFEVKLWMNNSLNYIDFDSIKKKLCSEDFQEHIKYVFRHIFNFYKGPFFDNILDTNLFLEIEKINTKAKNNKEKFPYILLKMENLCVEDYLVLLALKDCINSFNFEIYYNSIPYTKLNSGCRYTLALECLKNICDNRKNTLLIIDEPENSLHLTVQKEIAEKRDNLEVMIATHSPAFAMSLMNENPDQFILHILSRNSDKVLKDEIIKDNYLKTFSLDEVAAEFFAYVPFLDEWDKINPNINEENMIDINKFYDEIKELE